MKNASEADLASGSAQRSPSSIRSSAAMGIKGLTSLLADDPRRFGARWILGDSASRRSSSSLSNASTSTATIIYIDGPALLHHLLAAYSSIINGKNNAPIPPIDYLPPSLFGQVSPEAVYILARAFLRTLLVSGAQEVHLCMDGLASEHKTEVQLGRLADACCRADLAAKRLCNRARDSSSSGTIGAWDVPHLFAERSLEEAAVDLMQSLNNNGQCCVHHARGEAEGYIAHLIQNSRQTEKGEADIIILSNDSDFLVYDVPGFVPLHSLRFESDSTCSDEKSTSCTITGWRYCRTRFLAAFSNLTPKYFDADEGNDIGSFATMAAVSALAGNDYSLPRRFASALCSARSAIVQSDISGLRRKERKAPSAKATATAVIRFVGHFASRGSKGEGNSRDKEMNHMSGWLWQLVIAATNEGKGKDEREVNLYEALLLVRQIYEKDATVDECLNQLPSCKNVDLARVLDRNSFFCRPVLESFGNDSGGMNSSRKRRIVNTKKNQRKGRKKRASLAPKDCNQLISCRSMWMLPCLVNARQKMYNIIAQYLSKSKKESRRLLSVQECCRVGTSEFKEVSVYIPESPSSSAILAAADDSSDAFRRMLDYCFCRDSGCVEERLKQLPLSFWYPFLSAMLLPSRSDALLLFIVVNAPKVWHGLIDVQTSVPVSEELLSTARRMHLALYHTNLVLDALTYCANVDGADLTVDEHVFDCVSPSLCFRDGVTVAIWNIIQEEVAGEESLDVDSGFMDVIFESVARAFKGIKGKQSMDGWRFSSCILWEQYLHFQEKVAVP